ncbi:MAG TPA: type II TA system antitoxin MqsA family protein [Armatimonadota bacterium]|jgi:putative zinc finger/helix-turn-helix YgiT family protein
MRHALVCDKCGLVNETHVEERQETLRVKGEEITHRIRLRICDTCGAEVYDEELDTVSQAAAFNEYRRRHDIPGPEELRSLREAYGLSQRDAAAILGFGEVSFHRYENGSVPDKAHANLLRDLRDPWEVLKLLLGSGDALPETRSADVEARVRQRAWENTPAKVRQVLDVATQRRRDDPYTGNRKFCAELLREMMVFFVHRLRGSYKTKVNKLLFYSDFLHFRHFGVSISGATYVHLTFGPVPDQYEDYLFQLEAFDEALERREVMLQTGDVVEQLVATRAATMDLFSSTAERVLESVAAHFEGMTSKQVVELSHEEPAYQETTPKERIPYTFAAQLRERIPLVREPAGLH